MKPLRVAYGFLGSFLSTTFLLQWWQLASYPNELWMGLATLGVLSLVVCVHKQAKPYAAILFSIVIGSSVALMNVAHHAHVIDQASIENFAQDEYVVLHGFIVEEPDARPMQTKYTVDVDTLTTEDEVVHPAHGRVLVTARDTYPPHLYGDEVVVHGKLQLPEMIDTFDYAKHLALSDVYATMYQANVTTLSSMDDERAVPVHVSTLYRTLIHWKMGFESRINAVFPEPHSSFLAGLLTGSRKGIPEHILQDFKVTGITHIIAISGYNITIVITILSGLLFFIPLRWRFIPLSLGIIAFTLLVGASASVVRAAIMGVLGLVALSLGRQKTQRVLILWTAFFMLLWNPHQLWNDPGFQLSFAAIIGLSEFSPLLEPWLKKIPDTLGLRTSLRATVAAQIATYPITALQFHQVSIIAPITNLLVAPLVPVAMLFGFIGTVLSMLSLPLGQLFGFVAWGSLSAITVIAHWLAQVPLAAFAW